jgi:SAM-dependent methyltransferase
MTYTLPPSSPPETDPANPYFWPMLQSLPYFRGLLRTVEAGFYRDFDLPSPVFDLGCGDGHFAEVVFDRPLDVGLDPALYSLREAKTRNAYKSLVNSMGNRIPYPDATFASALSNSVLEHIPDLQSVLDDTARVLQKGASFIFCVPNHRWPENLAIAGFLKRIGLHGLAAAYTRLFIRISRHVNMLSPEEWQARLEQAGFSLENWWHYFPPAALHALEWGHYWGLPSWISRVLFGRWVLVPARWNLALTARLLKKHALAGADQAGTYTWFVARRR